VRPAPTQILECGWVAGSLWQGSFPPLDGRLRKVVDAVVFAAEELQPHVHCLYNVMKIYAPNDDADRAMTEREWEIATKAAAKVRYLVDRDKRVLVTCHAGLNRSGLISALTLMLPPTKGARSVRTPSCLTSGEAIRLVRRARGQYALSNRYFERAIVSMDGVLCPGRRPAFSPLRA